MKELLGHVKHFVPSGIMPKAWWADKCTCGSDTNEKHECKARLAELESEGK